jgi:O-succinylbenzoic acid--CoA ligase
MSLLRPHFVHYNPDDLPLDFWESPTTEVMISQTWAKQFPEEVEKILSLLPPLSQHIWLTSSGTLARVGSSKWIALSKIALFKSAEAVIAHHDMKPHTTSCLILPLFHVGGLGLLARARLLQQKVYAPLKNQSWTPSLITASECMDWDYLSLVPTQLFDLVNHFQKFPEIHQHFLLQQQLRPKIMTLGGDQFRESLRQQAESLKLPIFPSYGMTECGSQVATAKFPFGALEVLPHTQVALDENEKLKISTTSLFSCLLKLQNEDSGKGAEPLTLSRLEYPEGQWFTTGDQVLIETDQGKTILKILGRLDRQIKIKGEKVSLDDLEEKIKHLLSQEVCLLDQNDERRGASLILITEKLTADLEIDLEILNTQLYPHEKIHRSLVISQFPRNSLGKILRLKLQEWCEKQLNTETN